MPERQSVGEYLPTGVTCGVAKPTAIGLAKASQSKREAPRRCPQGGLSCLLACKTPLLLLYRAT